MCGIAAIINKQNNPVPESLIEQMTRLVNHRGPDDEGFYHYRNIALGHRRLSIIDLSPSGHQPMFYQENVIVYNGEIYNYIEIKEGIKEGDEVITGPYDVVSKTLKDDTEVKVVDKKELFEKD